MNLSLPLFAMMKMTDLVLSLPLFAMMKMTGLVRTHSENNTQECEETDEWKSTDVHFTEIQLCS